MMKTMYLWLITLIVLTPAVHAENNIKFLDKSIIQNLSNSVFEIVVSKLEGDKIQYAKPLPFDRLSYKERNEKYHSIGTAFFINDKELMTAAHVLDPAYFSLHDDFSIRDGEGAVYPFGNIKKYSDIHDICVFELQRYPEKRQSLKFSEQIDIGDTVFSVGNAQGEGISFRAGQVASFTIEPEYGRWKNIRFTSPASPGNSGGPLLDIHGEVLGLIVRKNASENYNIAVPIAELEKLSDKAEFNIRRVSMALNGEQNSVIEDWSLNLALPDSTDNLNRQAQDGLDTFFARLNTQLSEKFAADYFPDGARYRAYLRNQPYIIYFGELSSDPDFIDWNLQHSSMSKSIAVSAHQDISVGKANMATLQLMVEKPQEMALADFIAKPQVIMDNILKAIPVTRELGGESIRIVSLGAAERSETWRDNLGRPWTSSLWFLAYEDSFIYTHCLPYPRGVLCYLDSSTNTRLKQGYLTTLKENLNEAVVGYSGEVQDWLDYLALPVAQRPKIFHDTRMAFAEQQLTVDNHEFDIQFTSPLLTAESDVHFHLGYANDQRLGEDILLFEVFPKKGVISHYRVQKLFSPSDYSSDTYQSAWEEITRQSGDFSGKLIHTQFNLQLRQVMPETRKTFEAPDGKSIEQVFVVGCNDKPSAENVEEKCAQFIQATRFK